MCALSHKTGALSLVCIDENEFLDNILGKKALEVSLKIKGFKPYIKIRWFGIESLSSFVLGKSSIRSLEAFSMVCK